MNDEEKAVKKPPEKPDSRPLEDLAKEAGTEEWVLAGVKARNGWPIGQLLSPTEYAQAVQAWLSGPTVQEVN